MSDSLEALETDLHVEDFGILSLSQSDFEDDDLLAVDSPPKSILDLPEEIVVEIFSYISLPELYHSVALTCKRFCRLTRDPSVRRSIYLSSKSLIATPKAERFVEESHRAASLTLHNRNDSNQLLSAALLGCKRLAHLELKFCQPLNESSLSSLSAAPVVSNLVHFSLQGSNLASSDIVGGLRQFFASASNLRHLNLFGCKILEGEDLVSGYILQKPF